MAFNPFLLAIGIVLLCCIGGVLSDDTAAPSTSVTSTPSSSLPTTAPFFSANTTFSLTSPSAASVTAASNLTSMITSTTSPSPSGPVTSTADSWWFPLIGLSDDASTPWGANVSFLNPTQTAGDVTPDWKAYEIIVNSTNPVSANAIRNNPNPLTIVNSHDEMDSGNNLVVTTNGDPTLILGPNSVLNLTASTNGVDLVPTVPFGINYGHSGVWNGSVTLGGYYDANRIASTTWFLLPDFSAGNSSILEDGTENFNVTLLFRGKTSTHPALLDINADTLILPSSLNCSNLVVESLTVSILSPNSAIPLFDIVIPSNLTSSPDRCVQRAESDPNYNSVVLGRPFFQAAYMYVDAQGSVYLAAAHQYDVGINAQPFDARARLAPVPQPAPQPSFIPAQNAAGQKAVMFSLHTGKFDVAIKVAFAGLGLAVSWIAMSF